MKKSRIIILMSFLLLGIITSCNSTSTKPNNLNSAYSVTRIVTTSLNGICEIIENGKIGYQKEDGTILVNPIYDLSDPSPEEHEDYRLLGKKEENGTVVWGHVTDTGIVIEPQFNLPYSFQNYGPKDTQTSLAIVSKNEIKKILKKDGTFYVSPEEYTVSEDIGGFILMQSTTNLEKLGLLPGESSLWFIQPKFEKIIKNEDTFSVFINGMEGKYDMDGILIVDSVWKTVSLQEDGYLIVSKDRIPDQTIETGTEGVIKLDGSIVLDPIYAAIYEKHDGYRLILDRNHQYGYINENYQIAVEPQYEYGGNFSEGLACVEKNKSTVFIDKQGNSLFEMPKNYTMLTPFKNGFGLVATDIVTYYYSFEAGEKNIQYQFYRYGYMNQKGEILYTSNFFVCEDRSGAFPNSLNLYNHFMKTGNPIIISPKEDDFITIDLDEWLICSPSESMKDFSKKTINANGDYYVGENQTITFAWAKENCNYDPLF